MVSWVVVGVLLIGAVGLLVFATPLFGNRALIVRSGSMVPAITVGDVVIVHPGEYGVGDAIAYRVPGRDSMVVTHRIVEIKDGAYTTKGDANGAVDNWVVGTSDVIGKVLFTVPWVGKVLAFAKTKAGFAGLVLLPALVVILSEVRVIWRELRRKAVVNPPFIPPLPTGQAGLSGRVGARSSPDKGRLGGVLHSAFPMRRYIDGLSARLAVILLMIAVMTPATWALFSDSATSTNNVFAAAAVFATPTPTPTPPVGIATHVVISEVQIAGGNADEDFIELYNPTGSSVNIGGWQLRKKNDNGNPPAGDLIRTITAGTIIQSHGFFLWANFSPVVSADQSDGAKNITPGDSIVLLNGTTVIDQVAWGSGDTDRYIEGSAFPTNPPANQSIERKAYSTSTATSMTGVDATKGNGFDADNNSTDFVLRAVSEPQNSGSATETP